MCDTFNICTSTEESAFARNDGKDSVWVLIEGAEGRNSIFDEVAAEGIQGLGAIEL
jgi:hypothetical protein